MDFPQTNKPNNKTKEGFGENAALLEERLTAIDWSVFLKAYAMIFSLLLTTMFLMIVVIRLAFMIF